MGKEVGYVSYKYIKCYSCFIPYCVIFYLLNGEKKYFIHIFIFYSVFSILFSFCSAISRIRFYLFIIFRHILVSYTLFFLVSFSYRMSLYSLYILSTFFLYVVRGYFFLLILFGSILCYTILLCLSFSLFLIACLYFISVFLL